jgi:DNA-binding LacI/PurR family transcriptional regulator
MPRTNRPSIYQIADLAGVSIGTVSRVMNGKDRVHPKTRAKILAIARELDYRPTAAARGLATRRMYTLMLLVTDISNIYFAEIAKLVSRHAESRGYRIILSDSDESAEREATFLETLTDRHVDGAIIAPISTTANVPRFRRALEAGCPIVLLDTTVEGLAVSSVFVDNEVGASMAVRHLYDAGHRRIAFVCGNIGFQTNRRRYEGFRAELARLGLPAREEYFVMNQDFLLAEGLCGVERLIALNERPTAIFATSDLTAMACVHKLRREGLSVPADMAVVGFDDLMLAPIMEVPLTTVAQPKAEIARRAVDLLLDQVEGRRRLDVPETVVLEPTLIVRESG